MSSSWLFRSSHSRFLFVLVLALAGCRNDPPPDPRFDDPALRRPNDSKKLTVVFVDGVPVPADQASTMRTTRGAQMPPSPPPARMNIRWRVPESWTSVPPSSSVRLAEYRVPASDPNGVPAELGVFYLGPAALAVDETLQRWASSFDEASAKEAKRTTRPVGAQTAHVIEASGTYQESSMAEGKDTKPQTRPDWALLGAIVETSEGPYYFKMVGPKQVVAGARDGFLSMIDSVGDGSAAPAASGSAAPAASGAASR